MSVRTKEIEFPKDRLDYPKSDFFCYICNREIKRTSAFRTFHPIDGGHTILHPDDEHLYESDGGDLGMYPIGGGCARKLGLQWTRPAIIGQFADW